MRFAIITARYAALLVGARVNATDVRSRIIEGEVDYRLALAGWDVPSVVMEIANAARIPAGIEVDGCCLSISQPAAFGPAPTAFLKGKRVGDALNALIAVDPRYA